MKFDILVKSLLIESSINDEYRKAYDQGDYEKCKEMSRVASETQRSEPEEEMLDCVHDLQSHGMYDFSEFIEHIGDLAHRAQKNEGTIINVDEKIKMVEKTMPGGYRWSMEQTFQNMITSSAESYVVDNIKELKDLKDPIGKPNGAKRIFKVYDLARKKYSKEIEKKEDENRKYAIERMLKYAKVHEQYNHPVTELGLLGKEAAIALGKLNFLRLRNIVIKIRKWLNHYNTLSHDEKIKFFLKPF